jgi:sodium-dependent dicarboxylate transporter 2/3/5
MTSTLRANRRLGVPTPTKRHVGLVLGAIVFVLPYVIEFDGLSVAGHRALSVFLLAIVFWVTEAIPLYATAALIIFLQILLISDQALFALPESFEAPSYTEFYATLANPVLMLFLGGFFLADGAAKYKLDRSMASVLLRPFGVSPRYILLGLMLITAAFSMFMSNTATTATLMAVVLPVIAGLDIDDKLRTALALSIPIAANVGGIGTPVGTPPNAIALGGLGDAGISVSFVEWMVMAVPMMIVLLLFSWWLLIKLFPAKTDTVHLNIKADFDRSRGAQIFYVTFAVTVLLWLTEPIHGIKSTIVGFLPVVVLLATRVFSSKELRSVQWHILWLVAGGIALGLGVSSSGLDVWLIDLVSWDRVPGWLVAGLLALTALVMSTVISNSAAANLLIPIGLTLALSGAVPLDPIQVGFFIAIGASLAMALPISTPPNAIAYSTGAVQTSDMARAGIVIGLVGLVLFVVVAPLLWSVVGVAGA